MTFYNNKLNDFNKFNGNDYSKEYVANKNAYFYINREGSMSDLIVFKPFLTDLSYDLKLTLKPSTEAVTNANPSQVIESSTIGMKIGISVPATSLSEAKANRQKVSKLMTWLRDPKKIPVKISSAKAKTPEKCRQLIESLENRGYVYDPTGGWKHPDNPTLLERFKEKQPQKYKHAKICGKEKYKKGKDSGSDLNKKKKFFNKSYTGENMVFRISFANLVQSGKYDNEKQMFFIDDLVKTEKSFAEYALRCFLSNVTADVDLDMGFFEDGSDLIPKAYNINFDVDILNRFESGIKVNGKAKGGPFKNIVGFYKSEDNKKMNLYEEDNYHKHDSKYWPFGITKKPKQNTFNNSLEAKYTNKSKNKIQFKKYEKRVEFFPFLSKLSVVRKIDSKGMQEFKHLTGTDRIVFDTKMPIYSLGFTTNAINVAHSRQILYNYQKLMRMIYPTYVHGDTAYAFILVRVGNLIGSGTGFFSSDNFVRCVCNSLSIKPKLDFGFFEQNGMLFPKTFDISLSLEVNDHDFGA